MRPRIDYHCNASQTSASSAISIARSRRRLHVTTITDRCRIDITEVAHLISRCRPSDSDLDPHVVNPSPFHSRLRIAMQNSLVCVAAYALENQILRKKASTSPQSVTDLTTLGGALDRVFDHFLEPFSLYRETRPQVLVGFARAVGDASLVATIHDVVVAPEARRRGVGAALLDKLTRELYTKYDIVDVGAVVPGGECETFFSTCSFGDDSEGSMTMYLSPCGLERWQRCASAGEAPPTQ